VGPISLDRYATEGWLLEQDTLIRQKRNPRKGHAYWERMVKAARELEGFEVWGAEIEGNLAASLMFVQIDDCIDLLYQQSLHHYLPKRVNNALLFSTTKDLIARPGIQMIHNGLHSLDAPASVDQFKVRLGYTIKPLRQRVMINPRIERFYGPNTLKFLEILAGYFPENETIQKTEGLMRFYSNGKLPLMRQQFPVILEPERDSICQDRTNPSLTQTELLLPSGQKVIISPANVMDLDSLVALHLTCFSEEEHFALKLGKPFLRDAYRWFITAPENLVLIARLDDKVVGLTTLSSRPYNIPMIKACKWTVLQGLLRRPWLAIRPDWLVRLTSPLFSMWRKSSRKAAQIAFTGIAPDFQGQGIGQALKRASIQACREWGSESVSTGVRRGNTRAKALNERYGFVEVPELNTKMLIHLRLTLNASAEEHPKSVNDFVHS
jgi:ribosomal protein S18 acetylase RimI-like enzyme